MAFRFEQGEWTIASETRAYPLGELAARAGRPIYVYDLNWLRTRVREFRSGITAGVHYAMKANSHARLLRLLQSEGCHVDVVSLGELQKAMACGFRANQAIFSGVAKDEEDIRFALAHGILQLNAESFEELKRIAEVGRACGRRAPVALRVNIHLDAPTHKHIQTSTPVSKFGIDIGVLPEVLAWMKTQTDAIAFEGLAVHIGSQILDTGAFEKMAVQTGQLYRDVCAQGFALSRLDLGGGLGIDYTNAGEDDSARLEAYKRALTKHQTAAQISLEPGRFLVARAGVLLAKVVYIKRGGVRTFAILNAGMNALMRPALYSAYHRILPVRPRAGAPEAYDVVGPICESTDIFAEARVLAPLEAGDWLGVFEAGAYGAVMANTYNESPLPAQWSLLDDTWEIE